MKTAPTDLIDESFGNVPELVPVFVPGTDTSAAMPQGQPSWVVAPMEDLLGDALFGDVIDISDLIPTMLSPSPGAAGLAGEGASLEHLLMADGAGVADALAGAQALVTVLYDEDDFSGGSAI
jgi:hypothetical protein